MAVTTSQPRDTCVAESTARQQRPSVSRPALGYLTVGCTARRTFTPCCLLPDAPLDATRLRGPEEALCIHGLPHLGLDSPKLALTTHDGKQWPEGPHTSRCLRNGDDPIAQVRPFAFILNEHDEVNQRINSLIRQLSVLGGTASYPSPVTARKEASTLRIASADGQLKSGPLSTAGSTAFARQMAATVRVAAVVRQPHCRGSVAVKRQNANEETALTTEKF